MDMNRDGNGNRKMVSDFWTFGPVHFFFNKGLEDMFKINDQ